MVNIGRASVLASRVTKSKNSIVQFRLWTSINPMRLAGTLALPIREAALRPGHTSRRTGLTVLCQNFRFWYNRGKLIRHTIILLEVSYT